MKSNKRSLAARIRSAERAAYNRNRTPARKPRLCGGDHCADPSDDMPCGACDAIEMKECERSERADLEAWIRRIVREEIAKADIGGPPQ